METMRVAIATDDGEICITRHFGDARYYDLYEIDNNGFHFLQRLENTVDVEEVEGTHGDPRKASGIGILLKLKKVNVAVSKVFGPNIKRLVKQYACVLVTPESIKEILALLVQHVSTIEQEVVKGEQRSVVDLRKLRG